MAGTIPASIRRTTPAKWLIVPRLIAALPLTVFGAFHLTGMTPLMQILERASIPLPGVNYYVAPLVMVAAGLSLGFGYYARVGAVLGAVAMIVAAYSKLVITEWPGSMEPPLALPIVVFAACAVVLVLGAGAWSADHRSRL
ncbi:MAG: DoxX family protein [Phycisphaerales bacterium]|nr:DoxX family protein [Phycisphaerales bacterium]